jgi:DNA-binding MarR family transcriptional regulator
VTLPAVNRNGIEIGQAHLAYLLHMATRRMRAEAEHEVPEPFRALSAAQARLLDSVPVQGVRVTTLSSSMLVSKQGLGQLVNQLVSAGFVAVETDPTDARARVIRCTELGREAQRVMRQRLADVEEGWRDQVGAERYGVFREVLAELVSGFVT